MSHAMATLLIDAGNTRIKFGLLRPGCAQREPHSLALSHTELGQLSAWLVELRTRPDAAIGVSVASSAVTADIADRLQSQYGIAVQWVRSEQRAGGVVNLYDEPAQLGSDRWVALVGLAGHTPHTALLASFGTATTIDTLGAAPAAGSERHFQGGVILPGPELMLRSLANGTAQLPYAEGATSGLPRNTHTAIRSGVVAAQAGAVMRQWRATLTALNTPPQLYCAGGGWPLVAQEVADELARCRAQLGLAPEPPIHLGAPVLDGLARLAGTLKSGPPTVR